MTAILLALLSLTAPAAAEDLPSEVDERSGRGLGMAYGAAYGAYLGGTTGYLVGEAREGSIETDASLTGIFPGAVVGSAIGAGTAALVLGERGMDPDQMTWMSSATALGGFMGHQLARAAIAPTADGAPERVQAAQLAGTLGGAGIAWLREDAPSTGASLHYDLATAIGWQTAAGVSDLVGLDPNDDIQARAGLALAGGATFLGVATLAERQLDGRIAPTTLGLAAMDGLWLGAWAPYALSRDPSDAQRVGGVRVGLGTAYVGGLLISAVGEPSPRSAALQGVGFAAGNALGAGIPLALGEEGPGPSTVAPMLAAGLAGQALAAGVAPRYALTDDDRFLVTTLGAWTGYQVGGWAAYASRADQGDLRPLGYALTAGGAGTLMTVGLAPLLEVRPSGSFQMLAAGGWGSWFGAWTGHVLDLESDTQWLVTLGSGDAALLGAAAAQAAGWQPGWRDVALINGLGVVGTAAGGLFGVIGLYDEENWDPMIASTLVGSGAGLVAGAVLSARLEGDDPGALVLPTGRSGHGLAPAASVRPWTDDDGNPGMFVELRVDEVAVR